MFYKILTTSLLLVSFISVSNISYGQTSPTTDTLIFSNFFSPNGDGYNDTFIISGLDANEAYHLLVYNLLGDIVYENARYQNDWDGKSNAGIKTFGKLLPEAIYYYVLTDSQDNQHKGQVTIKR